MDQASSSGPDDPAPGAPRWAKVLGVVLALVVAALVVSAVAGGGHGPQRHVGGGAVPGATA